MPIMMPLRTEGHASVRLALVPVNFTDHPGTQLCSGFTSGFHGWIVWGCLGCADRTSNRNVSGDDATEGEWAGGGAGEVGLVARLLHEGLVVLALRLTDVGGQVGGQGRRWRWRAGVPLVEDLLNCLERVQWVPILQCCRQQSDLLSRSRILLRRSM